METQEFLEKLLSGASLDEVDFACDLERVLADQVKYLRGVLAERNRDERLDRDALVRELRSRLDAQEREAAALRAENLELRLKLAHNRVDIPSAIP